MKWMIILLILTITLLMGCQQATTPTTQESPAVTVNEKTNEKADPLAGLSSAPDSYCVGYSTAATSPTGNMYFDLEYCKDKGKVMVAFDESGETIKSFCLDGQGWGCYGQGDASACSEDTAICNSLDEPFAKINLDQFDAAMYENMPRREVAGLSARCFRADVLKSAKAAGQNIPEQMRYMDFCYHPQYKYLLYYSFGGATTEVKNFVTPAPAGKFVLPSEVVE